MSFLNKYRNFRRHRLLSWLIAAILLLVLIAFLSPAQIGVTVYKLALVSIAVVLGYHLDRGLFPYASPGSYLSQDWKTTPPFMGTQDVEYPIVAGYQLVFAAVLLRRAIIVLAVVIGVTMGL
ncbi:putative holin [Serratia fonticola]|jgi:hypothetical protein|uniref:putative holin n=1 Tax=Serratia fonticola TaxID=47917 RepID=UPI001379094C|nr:putative holin [Serratia fonticola]MBL5859542.1 putative holin [Serratia fonticola]NCG55206.1 hypothetical protein [Serratia fonticola]